MKRCWCARRIDDGDEKWTRDVDPPLSRLRPVAPIAYIDVVIVIVVVVVVQLKLKYIRI